MARGRSFIVALLVGVGAFACSATALAAQRQACPRLGGVVSLTGAQGMVGRAIAEAGRLAVDQVNAAGGVKGCRVQFLLRDDGSQPVLAVEAARFLVDVGDVNALVGLVGSGNAVAVVNAVSAPRQVPTFACCAVSPELTRMASAGKTGGYFFRTLPTGKSMALAYGWVVANQRLKRTVVIYVNNDFGAAVAPQVKQAIEKMGGEVVGMLAYNENQASYRAEVLKAMALHPDSLLLMALSQDGALILREWFSLGGDRRVLLHNTLRSPDVLKGIGRQYLAQAVGIDNGTGDESARVFEHDFRVATGRAAVGPGLHAMYDATVVALLAMQAAPGLQGALVRDAVAKLQDPQGETVGPGVEGLRRALEALKAGRSINYVGATGAFRFDANGDVRGPMLIWRVESGQIVTQRTLAIDEVEALERVYER